MSRAALCISPGTNCRRGYVTWPLGKEELSAKIEQEEMNATQKYVRIVLRKSAVARARQAPGDHTLCLGKLLLRIIALNTTPRMPCKNITKIRVDQ